MRLSPPRHAPRRRPAAGRCNPARSRPPRRVPILASASRRACGTRARRSGTFIWCPPRVRPRSSSNGINSDLTFTGPYAIQGSFNGYQVWDISNPAHPTLKTAYYCPASQSDVSVYKNLLFVSAEAPTARLDCGGQGVARSVSQDRIRGIRIFDITDIANPKYIGNVQTCRGSHTHTVLVDPRDPDNVYVYISGSAERARRRTRCQDARALSPEQGSEFGAVPHRSHQGSARSSGAGGDRQLAPHLQRSRQADDARTGGRGQGRRSRRRARAASSWVRSKARCMSSPPKFIKPIARQCRRRRAAERRRQRRRQRDAARATSRGSSRRCSAPGGDGERRSHAVPRHHRVSRHRLAGGACEGYGLLLDIQDPAHPMRIDAAADSNFSYWHSATFNNDGTKVLFSDEWGGGGAPKCRATDPKEWGADALFTIDANRQMHFQGYYKLPAPQTPQENCVAHNGSLIPIPGRDIMVQAWYQGGISVFDWTDPAHAEGDRASSTAVRWTRSRMAMGGSWSVYWYNGEIVSSEIARGLDIFELTPSPLLTAERDRRREDRAFGLSEYAGTAEIRLAGVVRACRAPTSTSSSGRADCRPASSPRFGPRSPMPN